MDKKGPALNKRVWSLFEKAGFQTTPNSSNTNKEHKVFLSPKKPRKVDLYAHDPDLKVTIIGSNKSGGWGSTWTGHVNDYVNIGKQAGANKVLFVVTGKEVPSENVSYAESEGGWVWTERDLRYYEAVVDAIKGYAKYEILHFLGIKTREEKDIHNVLALRIKQPTTDSSNELFMFTAPPELLLRLCVLYRRAQGNSDTYQRMLRKNRLPKIRKFVSEVGSILPTNLVLSLSNKVTVNEINDDDLLDRSERPVTLTQKYNYDLVTLNIPKEYASMEIIDGQHRLYGFVDADPKVKRKFNLLVLGLKGLDLAKRRDAFVAINDNSRRMDANLVAYLKYTEDDSACRMDSGVMAIRAVVDLNGMTPFKDAIRLHDLGKQVITLKGFSGYDLKGLLGHRGLLRKSYPDDSPKNYTQALRIYFSTVRSLFKDEWKDPKKYIIATNRGISAFLKLLKSILKTEEGEITERKVKRYLIPLKNRWKTWEFKKLKEKYSAYVGSQGWKDFHREMVRTIQKEYPDFRE